MSGWPSVVSADRRLGVLSRDFAESIQRLLNATICNNIRIAAVVSPDPGAFVVGYKVSKSSVRTSRFPVAIKSGKPRCWLEIGFQMRMDSTGDYLEVDKSFIGAYAADDGQTSLCHFDYERDKQGYPEAHLQISGESAALAVWSGKPRRELDRLHFPTGGRRYRPTLEDVIEFLIVEGLADGRAGRPSRMARRPERRARSLLAYPARRRHPPRPVDRSLSDGRSTGRIGDRARSRNQRRRTET